MGVAGLTTPVHIGRTSTVPPAPASPDPDPDPARADQPTGPPPAFRSGGLGPLPDPATAAEVMATCRALLTTWTDDPVARADTLLLLLAAKGLDETTGASVDWTPRPSPTATATRLDRVLERTVQWLAHATGEPWLAPQLPEPVAAGVVDALAPWSLLLTAGADDGSRTLRALFDAVLATDDGMAPGELFGRTRFARPDTATALLDVVAFKSGSARLRAVAVAAAKASDRLGQLKQRNLDWMRGHYKDGTPTLLSFPKLIHVEMSTACNLRCRTCSITRPGRDREIRYLDLETLERLRPALPFISDCKIHGGGEPFLHPQIERVVEIFGEEGVRLNTVTNANVINERLGRLIGDTFSTLTVSVDGADRDTYEYVRVRGSWDRLLRGLDHIDRFRQPGFRLIIGVVMLRCNIHQLPELVRFTHEYGGQELQAAWLVPFHDLPWTQGQGLTDDPVQTNHYLDAAREVGRQLGVSVRVPDNLPVSEEDRAAFGPAVAGVLPPPSTTELPRHERVERGADRAGEEASTIVALGHKDTYWDLHGTTKVRGHCRLMYDRCMILVDGNVKPCGQSRYVDDLGSVHERSFYECWNGAGYQRLRNEFNGGTLPVTCRSCNFIRSKQLGSARLVYD